VLGLTKPGPIIAVNGKILLNKTEALKDLLKEPYTLLLYQLLDDWSCEFPLPFPDVFAVIDKYLGLN